MCVQAEEVRRHVEVCAEGGVLAQQLARRISRDGGAALIADYGHDGTKSDTFRVRPRPQVICRSPAGGGVSANLMVLQGFKGHQLHPVLSSPGSADLTADVDFSYLRRVAGGGVACVGPITQRAFLKNMGVDARMQASGSIQTTSDP